MTQAVVDYVALEKKAREISERRSFLQAQEDNLSKQIEDIQSSLVQEFGADYLTVFNDAVAQITAWETANASV